MIFDLQKANMFKRVSAYLFDLIIFFTVASGIALLLSMAFKYNDHRDKMNEIYDEYEIKYGVDRDISNEEFEKLPEEEKEEYFKAQAAFENDPVVLSVTHLVLNLILLILVFSILIAFLILEFAVPLFLRNGQTLGKKIFGIAVIKEDGVRITPVVLFVRSILGKCTIETLVPIFMLILVLIGNAGLMGILAIILLFAFELGLLIKTKTNSCIHDILSYTVAVDIDSQMIFETKEEMIEYKKKAHEESVEKAEY